MHLSRQGLFVPEEAAPLKKIKDRKHHPSQGDVDQKPHQRRVHQWLLQKKEKNHHLIQRDVDQKPVSKVK